MNKFKKVFGKSLATCVALATFMTTEVGTPHIYADTNESESNQSLKVASYNVYMLSRNLYPNWGQVQRADLIAQADFMKNNDIIIFNEAFDNGASNELLNKTKKEYPHQTPVLGRSRDGWNSTSGSYSSTVFEDGGVAIVSKHEIVEKHQHIYKDACGADNQSNKGFVYAKIKKDNEHVHVFGTHTQAEDSSCSKGLPRQYRQTQFQELSKYIEDKKIPNNEAVLIGGDLNVNKDGKDTTGSEYQDMLKTLNVNEPEYRGHNATWDPKTNGIAQYYYPDAPAEYLDYVFVRKGHAQPKGWYNNAKEVHSPEWSVTAYLTTYKYKDYSDHYPVIAGTSGTE